MSKWLKAVSVSGFGLLVAAALAVGAQSAFARAVTTDCPNDGFRFLGSCSTQTECTTACRGVHGPDAQGRCRDGCCECLF